MIKKLSLTFGSKTKAQEMLYLMHDLKEVVRQGYYEEEFPKVKKYCNDNDLFMITSKFKVLLAEESNYSNKGIRVTEKDKSVGMHFVYISKNEQKAYLASYYELIENNKDLGLLLGYPECCIEFFCNNFNEKDTNPEHQPTNFLTNISKREEDNVIISHFPCNSNCPASIEIAKRKMDLIIDIDKYRAEELMESLKVNKNNEN